MSRLADELVASLTKEIGRKKERMMVYRRQAEQAGSDAARDKAYKRESVRQKQLRRMRQHIFEAQEAVEAAVAQRDAAPFAPYRADFPKTGQALREALADERSAQRAMWVQLCATCDGHSEKEQRSKEIQ